MEFDWRHAGKRAAAENIKIQKQLAQRGALGKARLCWTHRLTDAVRAQSWTWWQMLRWWKQGNKAAERQIHGQSVTVPSQQQSSVGRKDAAVLGLLLAHEGPASGTPILDWRIKPRLVSFNLPTTWVANMGWRSTWHHLGFNYSLRHNVDQPIFTKLQSVRWAEEGRDMDLSGKSQLGTEGQ